MPRLILLFLIALCIFPAAAQVAPDCTAEEAKFTVDLVAEYSISDRFDELGAAIDDDSWQTRPTDLWSDAFVLYADWSLVIMPQLPDCRQVRDLRLDLTNLLSDRVLVFAIIQYADLRPSMASAVAPMIQQVAEVYHERLMKYAASIVMLEFLAGE